MDIQSNLTDKVTEENTNLIDFRGRLHRLNYFYITVITNGIIYFTDILEKFENSTSVPVTLMLSLFLIALVYISICAVIKRLNDLNYSRWLVLLALIPGITEVMNLWLVFTPAKYDTTKENVNLFDFRGYIHRLKYFFIIAISSILINALTLWVGNDNINLFEFTIFLSLLYIQICSILKRLNDTNVSRWLVIITFIPIINIALGFFLLFVPSNYRNISNMDS